MKILLQLEDGELKFEDFIVETESQENDGDDFQLTEGILCKRQHCAVLFITIIIILNFHPPYLINRTKFDTIILKVAFLIRI